MLLAAPKQQRRHSKQHQQDMTYYYSLLPQPTPSEPITPPTPTLSHFHSHFPPQEDPSMRTRPDPATPRPAPLAAAAQWPNRSARRITSGM